MSAEEADVERESETAPLFLLSNELLSDILLRLPVKSLCLFKCVCKSSNSFISKPQFVKLHLQRSLSKSGDFNHLQMVYVKASPYDDGAYSVSVNTLVHGFELSAAPKVGRVSSGWMMESCNGLICLTGVEYDRSSRSLGVWFRFMNPAIRSLSPLSPFLSLDWDQQGRTNFGFGYDFLTDTYKVIAVIYPPAAKKKDHSRTNPVKVFTMGTDSWRDIQCFPVLNEETKNGTYLNGTLNWITVGIDNTPLMIVSLDLGTETYTQLQLPSALHEVPLSDLGNEVLKGTLCVFHDHNETHLVIWQMMEFGVDTSWTRLVNVSYEYLQCDGVFMFPSCMADNNDILLLSNWASDEESIAVVYNQQDDTIKARTELSEQIHLGTAKLYVESLTSPS